MYQTLPLDVMKDDHGQKAQVYDFIGFMGKSTAKPLPRESFDSLTCGVDTGLRDVGETEPRLRQATELIRGVALASTAL